MSLLGTRRAAAELARALDGDSAPAARTTGTAPLVALGDRLRGVGAELEAVVAPREDFRAALRTRLVAVATVQAGQPTTSRTAPAGPSRAQKAVGVAAGALASVVAVSGVAVAGAQSLPGDPFYGVKRTAEGLQLRLAGDRVEEGERHLQFAATRLDEVRELALGRDASPVGAQAAADADWGRVRDTLATMDEQTRSGAALLERAWSDDRDAEALTLLTDFAADQSAGLQALLPVMADEARDDAEASLGLVGQVAATSSELAGLAPCTEACASGGSSGGSGTSGGECDCSARPSSRPSPGASSTPPSSPSSPSSPSAGPGASPGAAPSASSDPAPPAAPSAPSAPSAPGTQPTPTPPADPRPSSGPLPPVLTPPAPTRLPSVAPPDLSTGVPTEAPPPALRLPTLPVPSSDPVTDVVPG